MGYYRAGGWADDPQVQSGEWGAKLGESLWKDPTYRQAMNLPAQPFEANPARAAAPTLRKTTRSDMGYYRAGDDWSPPDFTAQPFNFATAGTGVGQPASDSWSAPSSSEPHYRRRPRMHVTNVRALRRAMRRVVGFARVARKVMTFTQHHKMKGGKRRKRF